MKRLIKLLIVPVIALSCGIVVAACGGGTAPTHVCNWGEWSTKTPASCLNNQVRERFCNGCHERQESGFGEALGHDWVDETAIAPTCAVKGYTPQTCARDGCALTRTKPGSDVAVNPNNHSMLSNWTVNVYSTCMAEGKERKTCLNGCSHYVEQSIAKNADNHNMPSVWSVTQSSTCITTGKERKSCLHGCGHFIEQTIAINANAHIMAVTWTQVTAPTCITIGKERKTCLLGCGLFQEQDIAKIAHNLDNGTITEAPTCTKIGEKAFTCKQQGCDYLHTEEITMLPHSYIDGDLTAATCTKEGLQETICKHCGIEGLGIIIAIADHEYGEPTVVPPTCTEQGYTSEICPDCAHERKSAFVNEKGHLMSDWVTTKEPSCTELGSQTRSCERTCGLEGNTETESISMLPHTRVWVETTPATCTTDAIESHRCTVCKDINDTQTGQEALDHVMSAWTPDEQPTCTGDVSQTRNCTRPNCTHSENRKLDATGHVNKTWHTVSQATCIAKEFQEHRCDECHTLTDTRYIGSIDLGNCIGDWIGIWDIKIVATCTEKETWHRFCSCGYEDVKETEIDPNNHNWGGNAVTQPNCTEDGYTTLTCSRCSDTRQISPTEKLGHSGQWQTVTAPTCDAGGSSENKCTRCPEVLETQTLPALPCIWQHTSTISPTCTTGGVRIDTCSRCGDTNQYSNGVPAFGHAILWNLTTLPKCETPGEETGTCQRDDCPYSTTRPVEALEHDMLWDGSGCGEEGQENGACQRSDCDYTETRDIDHAWGAWVTVTPADCVTQAHQERICTRCADTDARHHGSVDPDNCTNIQNSWWQVEPTCTQDGTRGGSCSSCYKTNYWVEVGSALGGECDWIDWYLSRSASCMYTKQYGRFCNVCHKHEYQDTDELNPENHWVCDIWLQYQSCTLNGVKRWYCGWNCGYEYMEINTAYGHNHVWQITHDATPTEDGEEVLRCINFNCSDVIDTRPILFDSDVYNVINMIQAIDDAYQQNNWQWSLDMVSDVVSTRQAYNLLATGQKRLITNYAILGEAEYWLITEPVIDAINQLYNKFSEIIMDENDFEELQNVWNIYIALPTEQKGNVHNYWRLLSIEQQFLNTILLEQEKQGVWEAANAIYNISPFIILDDEQNVIYARNAVNLLTQLQLRYLNSINPEAVNMLETLEFLLMLQKSNSELAELMLLVRNHGGTIDVANINAFRNKKALFDSLNANNYLYDNLYSSIFNGLTNIVYYWEIQIQCFDYNHGICPVVSFAWWINPPTCDQDGTAYGHCADCSRAQIYTVPGSQRTEHEWHQSEIVNPTCTDKGYTLHRCGYCSETKVTKPYIPPLGGEHDWLNWWTNQSATCIKPEQQYRYCNTCNKYEYRLVGEPNPHNHSMHSRWLIEPTCTSDGTRHVFCGYDCGYEYYSPQPAYGHNYMWQIERPATPTKDGLEVLYCINCGDVIDSQPIPFDSAVQNVIDMIETLHNTYGGNYTIEDEADIIMVRQAYDLLTSNQQKYVTNYYLLQTAEFNFDILFVQPVIEAIWDLYNKFIGVPMTEEDMEQVFTVRQMYDNLTTRQKQLLCCCDVDRLQQIENQLLKIDPQVVALIEFIETYLVVWQTCTCCGNYTWWNYPQITLDNYQTLKSAHEAAWGMYQELNSAQKQYIDSQGICWGILVYFGQELLYAGGQIERALIVEGMIDALEILIAALEHKVVTEDDLYEIWGAVDAINDFRHDPWIPTYLIRNFEKFEALEQTLIALAAQHVYGEIMAIDVNNITIHNAQEIMEFVAMVMDLPWEVHNYIESNIDAFFTGTIFSIMSKCMILFADPADIAKVQPIVDAVNNLLYSIDHNFDNITWEHFGQVRAFMDLMLSIMEQYDDESLQFLVSNLYEGYMAYFMINILAAEKADNITNLIYQLPDPWEVTLDDMQQIMDVIQMFEEFCALGELFNYHIEWGTEQRLNEIAAALAMLM